MVPDALANSGRSTFSVAVPYAVGSLVVAGVACTLAIIAASMVAKIVAVAVAVMGAYAFGGIALCGFRYAGDPRGFEQNVHQFVLTSVGQALASLMEQAARTVFQSLLHSLIYGKEQRN